MARIPDEQIDRLKQEVAVQRLVEGMGVTLKRHGADLIGLCPFHTPGSGLAFCFFLGCSWRIVSHAAKGS